MARMSVRFRNCCLSFCIIIFTGGLLISPVEEQNADKEYQVGAILWTQTSAEKAALSYQAFSLARLRLDQDFRANRNRRVKRAVIVDVDETVLDNSAFPPSAQNQF